MWWKKNSINCSRMVLNTSRSHWKCVFVETRWRQTRWPLRGISKKERSSYSNRGGKIKGSIRKRSSERSFRWSRIMTYMIQTSGHIRVILLNVNIINPVPQTLLTWCWSAFSWRGRWRSSTRPGFDTTGTEEENWTWVCDRTSPWRSSEWRTTLKGSGWPAPCLETVSSALLHCLFFEKCFFFLCSLTTSKARTNIKVQELLNGSKQSALTYEGVSDNVY